MKLSTKDLLAEAQKHITLIGTVEADCLRQKGSHIIDVREPHEFYECAIAGAVNIPRGLLEFAVDSDPCLCHRFEACVLYCRSGGRASLAAATLKQMGFTHVYVLNADFKDWYAQGRCVVYHDKALALSA